MPRAYYSGFYLYWQSANFKARYYDPAVGRFITADPTIPNMFSSQSFNRYMFVSGSPIQLIDKSGYDGEGGNTQSTTNAVIGGGDPPPITAGGKIAADFSNGGNKSSGNSKGKDNDYAKLNNAFAGSAPVAYVSVPASVAPQSNSSQQNNPGTGTQNTASSNNLSVPNSATYFDGIKSVNISQQGWIDVSFVDEDYGEKNLNYAITNPDEYAVFAKNKYYEHFGEVLSINTLSLTYEIQVHALLYKAHINRDTDHNNTSIANCGMGNNPFGNDHDRNRWVWDAIATGVMNRKNIYPNTRY